MNIPGFRKIKRIAGRLARPFYNTSVVLMYHRVGKCVSDPWSLCVSETHFEEQLQVLARLELSCTLENLCESMNQEFVSPGRVVITFDDGYADNYARALPLLKRYNVPATVFVTTDQVGVDREFWWDELQRILIEPKTLPDQLELVVNDSVRQWDLPAKVANPTEQEKRLDQQTSLLTWRPRRSDADITSRLDLYYRVWCLMQPMLMPSQLQILDQLRQWSGDEGIHRAGYRTMTSKELTEMASEPLIDIGAHTCTHPALGLQDEAFQQQEIIRSKQQLEALCNTTVTSLSYPYGSHSAMTRKIAEQSGIRAACTTEYASTWRFTDPLQIPRVTVLDWNAETFEREISQLLKGFN